MVKRINFFCLIILTVLCFHHTVFSFPGGNENFFSAHGADLSEAKALEQKTSEKETKENSEENIEINMMNDLFEELNELDKEEKEKITTIKVSFKDKVSIFWALPLSQKSYLLKDHIKKHKIAYGATAAIILFGTVYLIVRPKKKKKKKKKK